MVSSPMVGKFQEGKHVHGEAVIFRAGLGGAFPVIPGISES